MMDLPPKISGFAVTSEALRAATLNPAKFLGLDKTLGAIEPGEIADLVLLDADPLADIRNTQKINAVISNGRLLDRKALNKMLAQNKLTISLSRGESYKSELAADWLIRDVGPRRKR